MKMLQLIFLLFLIANESFSVSVSAKNEKSCDCFEKCSKNFTTNLIKDIQKVGACQRGCRFYSLALHTGTQDENRLKSFENAKDNCHSSCSRGYKDQMDESACKYGCSIVEELRSFCVPVESQMPQISYSLLIEESDVLIHPGEPDPDDSLTDPGLRKQFEKTLEALFDAKPKLPEIHFRNLPIRKQGPQITEYTHVNFKCPKFYGLDSKLEFRNGKIIIGDLYLFVGVFVFVVICFLLGHHIEARSVAKQLAEVRSCKARGADDACDREPLLLKTEPNEDHSDLMIMMMHKDPPPPDYGYKGPCDGFESVAGDGATGESDAFEEITLVFHDDGDAKAEKERDLGISI